MELEFECGLEPRPDTHSTGQHWRKDPSIRPLSQKGKTFVATAPEAQLVISSLLNVKNPGRFSQQPPLVRLNQGSSASSKQISCPQRQPRCTRPPACTMHLTLSASPSHLPPTRHAGRPPRFSPRGTSLAACHRQV